MLEFNNFRDRKVFAPTYMTHNEERGPDQLTQLFFAGGHGGVGGGDSHEWPLSDYALHWMVGELKRRGCDLAFDVSRIPRGQTDIPPKGGGSSILFRFIEGVTGKVRFSICCSTRSQVLPVTWTSAMPLTGLSILTFIAIRRLLAFSLSAKSRIWKKFTPALSSGIISILTGVQLL